MGYASMNLDVGLGTGNAVVLAHRPVGGSANDYRGAVSRVQSQRIAQGDYDGIAAATSTQGAFDAAANTAETWQYDGVLGANWYSGLSATAKGDLRDLVSQSGTYGYSFRAHQSDAGTNDATSVAGAAGDTLRADAKTQSYATWSTGAATTLGAWWSGLSGAAQKSLYDLLADW